MHRKTILLFLALLLSALPVVTVHAQSRQAVIYYNQACDECVTYIEGELNALLTSNAISIIKKDYINQRENRACRVSRRVRLWRPCSNLIICPNAS